MKDKDFEQLLKNSIQTYGHEYLSADDYRNNSPIPLHTFPDDFISDIVLLSQQPKKPFLRVIRILSVCAAVLVLITVIAVVPVLLRSRQQVNSDMTPLEKVSFPTDNVQQSADHTQKDDTSTVGQPKTSQNTPTHSDTAMTKPAESPSKSMESDSVITNHSREQESEWTEEPLQSMAEEVSEMPTEEPVVDDTFALPDQVNAELICGHTFFRLGRTKVTALAMTLADIMCPIHQQTDIVLPAQEDTIILFTLSSEDTMYLYGNPYRKVQVYVTEQAMAITGTNNGKITGYWIFSDDSDYETFRSMVQLLTENR